MWEKVIVKLLSPQLYYRPLRTDEKGVREVGAVSKALMKALCVFPRPILYLFFLLIDMSISGIWIWNSTGLIFPFFRIPGQIIWSFLIKHWCSVQT